MTDTTSPTTRPGAVPSFAMALACEPSLLIADEPTTGLDATIQSKIADLLAELKSELGITTMLISHDISVISRLSDSVAVMYGGRIVEEARSADLYTDSLPQYNAGMLQSFPAPARRRQSAVASSSCRWPARVSR